MPLDIAVPFFHKASDSIPLGFLTPNVLRAIENDNERRLAHRERLCWLFYVQNGTTDRVSIAHWLVQAGESELSEQFERLLQDWRSEGRFHAVLKGAHKCLLQSLALND